MSTEILIGNIFGISGGLFVTLSFLPGAIKTIMTKKTDHLSLAQYLIFHVGAFCFMSFGFILILASEEKPIGAYGLIISNLAALIMNSYVIFLILKNRKKDQQTRKEQENKEKQL